MAQLFRPLANSVARTVLMTIVTAPAVIVLLGFAWSVSPAKTGEGRAPEQPPVPFSHRHHIDDVGLDCRYCHATVETAAFAGMPMTHTCMTCHSQIWRDAELLEPVRRSLARDKPLTWRRVNTLPDYVFFDHSVHVSAGVGCVSCHGAVHEMALMRQAAPLTMGWCLDCHRDPESHLRPPGRVFDTRPLAESDEAALGKVRNHLRTRLAHGGQARLTDCSTCHR